MHPSPLLLPNFLFKLSSPKKKSFAENFSFGGGRVCPAPLVPQVTPTFIHKESDSSNTSKDFLQHLKGHRLFYNSILGYLPAVKQWVSGVQPVLAKKNNILEIFISYHDLSLFLKIFMAENACLQLRLVANWHSYTARNFPSYKNLLKAGCAKIQSFVSPMVLQKLDQTCLCVRDWILRP